MECVASRGEVNINEVKKREIQVRCDVEIRMYGRRRKGSCHERFIGKVRKIEVRESKLEVWFDVEIQV